MTTIIITFLQILGLGQHFDRNYNHIDTAFCQGFWRLHFDGNYNHILIIFWGKVYLHYNHIFMEVITTFLQNFDHIFRAFISTLWLHF